MEAVHIKKYAGTPFSVICSKIENEPGTWNSTKVAIYYDKEYALPAVHPGEGVLIGEYLRNYSSFGAMTFHPFTVDNEWYALYSAHYTALRVMKLHSDRIEDWCGADPSSHGFCPVEVYVPRYNHSEIFYKSSVTLNMSSYDSYTVDCDIKEDEFFSELHGESYRSTKYCNFAYMCGCVWGDDSSWKLKHIDLSQVQDKILNITDKLGYWQLPSTIDMRKCINMSNWEPGHDWVELTRAENINLTTPEKD